MDDQDMQPMTLKERRKGFKKAAAAFNAAPNADNWRVLKQWMLIRQAPLTMSYAQAERAFVMGRDFLFDVSA
jgi:hypothetical protein